MDEDEKLQPGDVVWFRPGFEPVPEFTYGRGPFILQESAGEVDGESYWRLLNMDGSRQEVPYGREMTWRTRLDNLRRDKFLTAVRRAKHGQKI